MVVVNGKTESWLCLSCLSSISPPSIQVQYEDATQLDGSGLKTVCVGCVPEQYKEEVEAKQQSLGVSKRKQPEDNSGEKADEEEEGNDDTENGPPPSKLTHAEGHGMTIDKYSNYSMVLRGNTEEYKVGLQALGLKYNRNLKQGGPGWIFPNALKQSVENFIANPASPPTASEQAQTSAVPSSPQPVTENMDSTGSGDMKVEDYSAHAIVVRGNTVPFKDALKSLGGSYNPKLKQGGPGWIFPAAQREKVNNFLANPSATLPPFTTTTTTTMMSPPASPFYTEPQGENSFIVKGQTRPIKDKLSALGGKWNKANVGWVFPNSSHEKVAEFLASSVSSSSSTSSSSSSSSSPSPSSPSSPSSATPSSAASPSAPSASSSTIRVEPYSEKALVVRGDTKPYKAALMALGCKWNGSLKGGCGWIVSKSKQAQIDEFMKSLPSGQ